MQFVGDDTGAFHDVFKTQFWISRFISRIQHSEHVKMFWTYQSEVLFGDVLIGAGKPRGKSKPANFHLFVDHLRLYDYYGYFDCFILSRAP